jgi:DNA phosphorothioation-dependent restriction protein DptG
MLTVYSSLYYAQRVRRIRSWEPSGPVARILYYELAGKSRGGLKRLLDNLILDKYEAKYPKLCGQARHHQKHAS